MSLIDFPTSPSVGQTYSFGTKTWTWNGTGWIASGGGPTGPTGPQGTSGFNGPTGPTGSGWVLLSTLTATSAATLEDALVFTSAFNEYMIELINLTPETNAVTAKMYTKVSSAFDTTAGHYNSILAGGYKAGFDTSGSAVETTNDFITLSGSGADLNTVGNTANNGLSGTLLVRDINNANSAKHFTGTVVWRTPSGSAFQINLGTAGGHNASDLSALQGIRFQFSSGNISTGKIRIWGLAGS